MTMSRGDLVLTKLHDEMVIGTITNRTKNRINVRVGAITVTRNRDEIEPLALGSNPRTLTQEAEAKA